MIAYNLKKIAGYIQMIVNYLTIQMVINYLIYERLDLDVSGLVRLG